MRWCRFGEGRYGVVRNSLLHDVTDVVEDVIGKAGHRPGDPFVAHLAEITTELATVALPPAIGPLAEARLLSPVAAPGKIIGAPANYPAHLEEASADPEIHHGRALETIGRTGLFLKATSCLVGPGEGIRLGHPDRRTDHEIEVGVVIGTRCSGTTTDDAIAQIAGYALALDITLRGPEERSFRKSLDTYGVLGPCLITPDEIGDPADLGFSLHVNGELRQQSSTRHLIKDIATLISWASHWYTLEPGDVLMTGTPDGVGPLQVGDTLTCALTGITEMQVSVSGGRADDPTEAHYR